MSTGASFQFCIGNNNEVALCIIGYPQKQERRQSETLKFQFSQGLHLLAKEAFCLLPHTTEGRLKLFCFYASKAKQQVLHGQNGFE